MITLLILSLAVSFLTELIFDLITIQAIKALQSEDGGCRPVSASDIEWAYKSNKPLILRRIVLLNVIIEYGGFLFFTLFSILFLILVYWMQHSILWTLLCIPGLIYLKFILRLISIALARVLV